MNSGHLSKPPPSASRPPHRASASIQDTSTYANILDDEEGGATRVQTVACAAKCNEASGLSRRALLVMGTGDGAQFRAQVARSLLSPFKIAEGKRMEGDGFFDRHLSSTIAPRDAAQCSCVARLLADDRASSSAALNQSQRLDCVAWSAWRSAWRTRF